MANRFVQKLSSFGELSVVETAELERATLFPRKFAARASLIREGDRPGPMFVVLEGWAFRYKILPNGSRQILAFLMPGDCCDLNIGLLDAMDHGIQTATEARVATISRAEADRLMITYPGIARCLYTAQLADEGILRAWIVSMGRRGTRERVAHLMCELYLRAHSIGLIASTEFALPLSQVLLADSLGMTPVHINRVLRDLRLTGAMELKRGMLLILDPAKLVAIAGFDENYLHRRLRQPR